MVADQTPTGGEASHAGQLSAMRRAIARVTSASAAVPQFHLRAELNAAPLLETRAELIERTAAAGGTRLSITDLLLRALALALSDNPPANAVWSDGAI